jgi:hypothetical protein
VTLKGGLVVEMRLGKARATKDIDLRMTGSSDDAPDRLQAAGRLDLSDHMLFEIQPDADTPEIRNEGMKYDDRPDRRGEAPLGTRQDVRVSWEALLVGVRSPLPVFWDGPYAAMAASDELRRGTLSEVTFRRHHFSPGLPTAAKAFTPLLPRIHLTRYPIGARDASA